ncbi:MAG: type VI secretion system tube protein TssD [Bacteroidota bacterium]
MSFKAEFEVNGKKYRVLHASYTMSQDTDATGRPSSGVRAGTVQLEVESTADTALAEWAFDSFKEQDGKITFTQRNSDQKMKELSFKNGYLVNYSESFTNQGENPMTEHFVITSKEIKIGNAEHKNEWPV